MTTLTIEIPPPLTEQLQSSGISQQQLETLVANFIQNYLHEYQSPDEPSSLPVDIADDLAQLTYLADDDLWLAAQTRLSTAETEQMQILLDKQQDQPLTHTEQETAQALSHRYNRTMLIRAKAAVLLKERGYDIASLRQDPTSDRMA